MATNRIFYAVQAVGIATDDDIANVKWMHGMQSVGITTNFNLEQIFELGQLALYQNIENIAEIEVTTERVLDGNPTTYGTAVGASNASNNIVVSAAQKAGLFLIIYPDTNTAATGTNGASLVYCSGMYPSNITYTFPVEGNSTESVTFVGNNKFWSDSPSGQLPTAIWPSGTTYSGINETSYDSPLNTVFRRQHFLPYTASGTKIPAEVTKATNGAISKLQTITVTADIGRENIFQLGSFLPYVKYANFPVAVTCDFEVISTSGDWVSTSGDNFALSDREIALKFYNGAHTLFLELGTRNKLTSVNYTGGDTGGGNATMTFSYQGFNAFKVTQG